MPDLFTADQLAERLQIQPATVRMWARTGKIPVRVLSPKVQRFELADVLAAIDAAGRPSTSRPLAAAQPG